MAGHNAERRILATVRCLGAPTSANTLLFTVLISDA